MQTNTFNMLLVWSKVFVLFVELFPSTAGVFNQWVARDFSVGRGM